MGSIHIESWWIRMQLLQTNVQVRKCHEIAKTFVKMSSLSTKHQIEA